MCLLMATSPLLKLLLGIIVLLVLLIPDWFKTADGDSMFLTCMDVCFNELSSYRSTALSTSIICITPENHTTDVRETAVQNNTVYSVTLQISFNNATNFKCEQLGLAHPIYGDLELAENTTLTISGQYLVYSEEETHIVLVNSEDRNLSLPRPLEIHINIITGLNWTVYNGDFQTSGTRKHYDFINISLKFEHHVPYYAGTVGITWLCLIPLVFVCGLIFLVYKVLQEKKTGPVTMYYKETEMLEDKLREISSRTHFLEERQHKYGGYRSKRIHSAPTLIVIDEHLDADS
ncbi:transmembrane protein 156 [Hyperolius riggenbachi]|uniref:transmembrane protein 156 n=1 Tax=Hyperolius riggenbachi TaxID=752182 RepID=UPI0035A3C15A